MKKNPIWILFIGIFILFVPAIIYLCFLIPQLKDEYLVLTTSSGLVSGAGFGGSSLIPKTFKGSGLYKLSITSATLLIVITLVNEFIMQIIGFAATIIISYIIYRILKGVWNNERRKRQNSKLAEEVARSVNETSK